MSDNVELVRSIFASWEQGDFASVEWADPDIVFESVGFDAMKSRGAAEMGRRWREWMSAWTDYLTEAEEIRELDGTRVLVLMRHGGRGKASGLGIGEVKRAGANIFELRDGKVCRLAIYWDRDRAFSDLGLEG